MQDYFTLADEILLEFQNDITEDQQPQLNREINSFMANEVCPGQSEVDYPELDVARFVPVKRLLICAFEPIGFPLSFKFLRHPIMFFPNYYSGRK